MRATPMSTEQRERLMEMCRYLFPEYKNIRFGSDWRNKEIWFDNLPSPKPDPRELYWFEVCVLALPERLHAAMLAKRDSVEHESEAYFELDADFQDGTEILQMFIWKEHHPIDHLYEQFKKLS